MADSLDSAQALAAMQADNALTQHYANRPKVARVSATECIDCGDDIPVQRQQAVPGCQRCIDCQAIGEK